VKFAIQLDEGQIGDIRGAIIERREAILRELRDYPDDEERDLLRREYGYLHEIDQLLAESLRGSPI
jgi:hypothetical protein